jgi:hypothetical protein
MVVVEFVGDPMTGWTTDSVGVAVATLPGIGVATGSGVPLVGGFVVSGAPTGATANGVGILVAGPIYGLLGGSLIIGTGTIEGVSDEEIAGNEEGGAVGLCSFSLVDASQ